MYVGFSRLGLVGLGLIKNIGLDWYVGFGWVGLVCLPDCRQSVCMLASLKMGDEYSIKSVIYLSHLKSLLIEHSLTT